MPAHKVHAKTNKKRKKMIYNRFHYHFDYPQQMQKLFIIIQQVLILKYLKKLIIMN
jgi:hypothetical protein